MLSPGVDGKSLDGMSEKRINALIESLKDFSYQPNPARRVYIEKKNSTKKRPLGIPSTEDKLVQEVVKMILESIYEPNFSDYSHGFRPNRSCHSALQQIQNQFTGITWFVEGDIHACFDSFDHHVLVNILRERIEDENFLALIWKMLKAGYMEQWVYNCTFSGTPQAELFGKVRSGQVRFLLGSTQKMGAGTNVQDRLIALHHLDVPWRPSDIEQQEGRILRQGNLNPKVKIFRYVTEGTFDSYSWQLIENKQKFIGQIMTSKSPVRSCEDVDEAALTYAEVKALATGNPYIKEKMDLDIQVSKLKLMKANHTSQKYRLEDNIAKHYPQQITILKERISGMQADIQTAKANLPVDKEQFSMKIGDTLYTDKKEAGTALVEMCKEIKTVNAPAVIGEYAGFKMAVSFDAFNHKFVMNLKGQLSHNLEVGSDPLGNISRINHALESMPKQLMEAQTKLETVEHQLETAKVEVTKPFEQEAELAEKLERLSALNALLNMDEKGNDGIDMDDEPEAPKSEKEVADRPAKNTPLAEKTVGIGQDKSIRQYADVPAERVSLKAKLEVMKAKVAGGDTEKPMPQKVKGKEETL